MSKSTPKPATAAQVRAFYRDEKSGAARLANAAKRGKVEVSSLMSNIGENARGRLAPCLIAEFNAKRPQASRYSSGETGRQQTARKAQAASLRALAVEQGVVKAGSVGPLPKSFLVAQGVIKG